jgi:hypothetical protein
MNDEVLPVHTVRMAYAPPGNSRRISLSTKYFHSKSISKPSSSSVSDILRPVVRMDEYECWRRDS